MNKTSLALAGATLTLLVALTGCSVGFTPVGQNASAEPVAPAAEPNKAASSEAPSVPDTPSDAAQTNVREQYAAVASAVTCPGGALTIDAVGSVVHVVGECADLTITGTGTVVLADTVTTLTVAAVAVVVSVTEVSTISVTDESTSAVVQWRDGTPDIIDDGSFSVITQEK